MQKQTEQWKNIEGYEGLYQVSNYGRIKSFKRGKERILKPQKNNWDYLQVYLNKNGKQVWKKVHRLVAEAFLENPNNYDQVNHKDENKQNNCVDNLEWCNAKHNINFGSRNKKVANKLSKQIGQIDAVTGEVIHQWTSVNECGRNGYNKGDISLCARGLKKQYKGYVWKYLQA